MDNTQEKSKSKAAKVGGVIVNVLLWVFVVFSVVVTIFVFSAQKDADGVPSLFGNSYISIVSDSMAPSIRTGDMIVVKKVSGMPEAAQCKVGDVITFYSPLDINGDGKIGNDIETHQITKVREANGFVYYTTMGTNVEYSHNIEDPEILSTSVIGIYTGTKVSGLGSVISFLGSSTGFLVCIVIPLAVFFLYELIRFVVMFIKVKGPKEAKAGLSAADEEEIKRKAIEEYLAKQAASSNASSQGVEPEKDAPVEETPAEEAPAEETPAEEAPAEEAPIEEAPVDEVPAEVVPTEENNTDNTSEQATDEKVEQPEEVAEENTESSEVDESEKDDSKTE